VTYAHLVQVRRWGGRGRMSSLIHTLETLSSVVGTWKRLARVLEGIALTSRRESVVFRSCH
jgi:hypothetical protein